MTWPFVFLIAGCLLAAAGQIFLKLGVTGASAIVDYLNSRLILGFALYGLGSILWVIALSKLPLSKVYPFTVLTFVLVYAASFAILGERASPQLFLGAGVVLLGLIIIVSA